MSSEQVPKKKYSPEQVRSKAEAYCAYQERAQKEMRDKLYEWGLYPKEVEHLIADLISDNFLNEERFAKAYTSGKFRIKHWGKLRIRQGLKMKGLPEKLIQKALKEIDMDDYFRTLRQLLEKKGALLKEKDQYKRMAALSRYAASKGFEHEFVADILKEIA